jgi:hypothetical protein
MKHLKELHIGYIKHLFFAWKIAFALLIHKLALPLFTAYVLDKLRDKVEQK